MHYLLCALPKAAAVTHTTANWVAQHGRAWSPSSRGQRSRVRHGQQRSQVSSDKSHPCLFTISCLARRFWSCAHVLPTLSSHSPLLCVGTPSPCLSHKDTDTIPLASTEQALPVLSLLSHLPRLFFFPNMVTCTEDAVILRGHFLACYTVLRL